MDNLGSQCQPEFKEYIRKECNTLIVYTPNNCTDLCAVTDAGIGKVIKDRMRKKYDADFESRTSEWTDKRIPTRELRVLYANWLSEAWKEFLEEGGDDQIKKAFQRCGMLNAQDGSEDHLIRVPGIKDYDMWEESEDEQSENEIDFEFF